MPLKQTKILTLERCECGAYRYIVARDQDRVVTFYVQHLFKTPEKRESKMLQLFNVKKSLLNFHDSSITESKRLPCVNPAEHVTLAEVVRVVTQLQGKE